MISKKEGTSSTASLARVCETAFKNKSMFALNSKYDVMGKQVAGLRGLHRVVHEAPLLLPDGGLAHLRRAELPLQQGVSVRRRAVPDMNKRVVRAR